MKNVKFKGIMPALVTPLTTEGKVNKEAIRQILDYDYAEGAAGFYICGSTGEGPVLTEAQRREVAEAVMEHNDGRGVVINHVGAASPEEVMRLASHAREIGCDAVSSVLPNFYFQYGFAEINDYYKRLSDAAGIPILAYAQGMMAGTDVVGLMRSLIDIENVIGIKFTLMNFYDLHRIKLLNNGDINVINGPDEMLVCGLTMGADAGIGSTYNVMCREYCRLFDAFKAGDYETAREQQYKVNKVIEVMIKHGVFRTVKHMLSYAGIDAGSTVFPGAALADSEKADIKKELQAIGYFEEYNQS